jgi:TatA/E family protein of Tat protein translocase
VLAFTLGFPEIAVIGGIALLLFGTRLPSVGRSLGSAIVQFRRAIKGEEDSSIEDQTNKTPNDSSK